MDRIPNNCIIMGFGARYIGKSYREFVTDYRVLTEAGIRCREEFDLDILSAISDPMREAEGLGAAVTYPEDGVPYAPQPLLQSIGEVSRLQVKDPSACARMNDRLLAVRRYAEYARKECAVQGWVEGGFAEACDLRDLNNMMMDIFDEPEAGIDLWSFARLTETFEQIHREHQATMIIISHQERIIQLADEIAVIAGGRIAHRGTTEEILPLILADTLGGCPVLNREEARS